MIHPTQDRVMVRRVSNGDEMINGIYIPEGARERPQEGEVIAVGPGKRNKHGKLIPLDVKSGDRVLFGKYAGSEIKVDGKPYIIMREEEILSAMHQKAS